MRSNARRGAAACGALLALALAVTAFADPRQQPGMLKADESGAAASSAAPTAPSDAKTPKRPDTPLDNTWLAPPLPGYALMFVLGGAVVALNLWSSKRTQLD